MKRKLASLLVAALMLALLFSSAHSDDLISLEDAPADETSVPEDDTPAPADETPAPADETPAPADETPAPADETPVPADETPAPEDETPAPEDETPAPAADDTPAPEDDTPAPAADETPAPEEEEEISLPNVIIFSSLGAMVEEGAPVVLSSRIEGLSGGEQIFYQWECDRGNGFEPVPGANGAEYTYAASAESLRWNWRLKVTIG